MRRALTQQPLYATASSTSGLTTYTSPFSAPILHLFPMPKDQKTKIGAPQKRGRKPAKPAAAANPSLPALEQLQNSGKKANLNSGGTRRNYAGYVKRGRDWLASHFSENCNASSPKGVDDTDLPSHALALFISYKCFHQNLKKGTGTSIHAAFKKYWEQL